VWSDPFVTIDGPNEEHASGGGKNALWSRKSIGTFVKRVEFVFGPYITNIMNVIQMTLCRIHRVGQQMATVSTHQGVKWMFKWRVH
jgi:hypothetical protein